MEYNELQEYQLQPMNLILCSGYCCHKEFINCISYNWTTPLINNKTPMQFLFLKRPRVFKEHVYSKKKDYYKKIVDENLTNKLAIFQAPMWESIFIFIKNTLSEEDEDSLICNMILDYEKNEDPIKWQSFFLKQYKDQRIEEKIKKGLEKFTFLN